jgi:hypothetical protein
MSSLISCTFGKTVFWSSIDLLGLTVSPLLHLFRIVVLVLYIAPIRESWQSFDITDSIIKWDTIFVGLGVLSFAFVCQHSSFIIAGSLERPTRSRWSTVTKAALFVAGALALCCGIGGYIGYGDDTKGNILNSLDQSFPANLARGLLGTTMLFVYPMESFVARHVCVVLFFQGRSAHEGDDTSVLNRRDRRITLTVILYLITVIPAALFENLGVVLASSGAVGGSCLSYIGPGAIYLGIHGGRFLELSRSFFGRPVFSAPVQEETPLCNTPEEDGAPLCNTSEDDAPLSNTSEDGATPTLPKPSEDSWLVRQLKTILWYLWLMPVWCLFASVGKTYFTGHVTELATNTPHPIRIGNVRYASANIRGGTTRVVMLEDKGVSDEQDSNFPTNTMLIRADSLPKDYGTVRTADGRIVALPPSPATRNLLPSAPHDPRNKFQSPNQMIGANLVAMKQQEEEEMELEDDPQETPPGAVDFLIAIFYVLFGLMAMFVGLASIYEKNA